MAVLIVKYYQDHWCWKTQSSQATWW